MKKYLELFRNRDFLLLWSGFTVSQLGDGLTWVALLWFVLELTGSTEAMGLLLFFYTAPTIIGGLVAGVLLDCFDRRLVMLIDNLIRGLAMFSVPVLFHLGLLQLWHVYLVAGIFGSLMMLSLAGGPALVPSLVKKDHLPTANALESVSWGLSDIVGRTLAGLLIGVIGSANLLFIDAASYGVLVLCLLGMRVPRDAGVARAGTRKVGEKEESVGARKAPPRKVSISEGFRFILHTPIIFSITWLFMIVNLGEGAYGVLLPLYSKEILHEGAKGFGLLMASLSMGELASSVILGAINWRYPLGRSISTSLLLAGASFLLLLFTPSLLLAQLALVISGGFAATVNIWAQTVRMRLIPVELRGRVFSILRTIIRSTLPLSGAIAGLALPRVGTWRMIILVGGMISLAGILGWLTPGMREDPEAEPVSPVSARFEG